MPKRRQSASDAVVAAKKLLQGDDCDSSDDEGFIEAPSGAYHDDKLPPASEDSDESNWSDDEDEGERSAAEAREGEVTPVKQPKDDAGKGSVDVTKGEAVEGGAADETVKVYRPGVDPIAEGEELVFDPSVYTTYHECKFPWSCYSVDVLYDNEGALRDNVFPLTLYMVAGSQAEPPAETRRRKKTPAEDPNRLYIAKWWQLDKTDEADSDDEDGDGYAHEIKMDDDDDGASSRRTVPLPPRVEVVEIPHPGMVNRVRSCPLLPRLCASWSSLGQIFVWDLQNPWEQVAASTKSDSHPMVAKDVSPCFIFGGHKDEGYALDWNGANVGFLATGSCDSTIRIWRPQSGGSWEVDATALTGHTASVESVQWKVGCRHTLASGSADGTIRFWDIRASASKSVGVISTAHNGTDVNCVSWAPTAAQLLLSGGDDGSLAVWDERHMGEPLCRQNFHKKAITAVDWHPTDAGEFAAASLDNTITIWDPSVEAEDPTIESAFPPQLLFHHMGQEHISDLKWHPQIPGVILSTAESGFNVFKTFNA